MDFGLGLVLSFTDNATAGINNAVNTLNQLTQTAENASNSLNQMASLSALSVVSGQLGSSFTSMGQTILSTLSQVIGKVNQTGQTLMYAEKQLDALYGGVGKGKAVISQIQQYAKESMFEFENLIPAVTSLKSVGIEAFDAITSSMGNSKNNLLDYASALASFAPQMKNAYGTGINAAIGAMREYIAEGNALSLKRGAGLDITGILGEEKGATIEDRTRQVADLIEKLGMLSMVDTMKNSPMVKLSNMADTLFQFLGMVSSSGVYDAFNRIIDVFANFVTSLDSRLPQLAKTVGEALTSLLVPVERLAQWIVKLADSFLTIIENNPMLAKFATIGVAIGGVLLVLAGIVLKFTSALSGLSLLLLTTGKSFSSIGGIIKTGVLKIMGALLPLTVALGLMYIAWKNDLAGIRTSVTTFVDNLSNSFRTANSAVNGSVENMISTVNRLERKGDFFSNLTIGIIKLKTAFNLLKEAWNDNTLSEESYIRMNELGLKPLVEAVLDLKYRFGLFKEGFIAGWREIGERVREFFSGFSESVKGTFLESLIDNITTFLQKLSSGDAEAWYKFGESFAGFTAKALAFVVALKSLDGTLGFFTKIFTFVGGITKLGGAIGKVFGGIKAFFSTVFPWVSQIVGGVVEVIQLVAGGAGTVAEALRAVFSPFAGIVAVITGIVTAVINFFSMLKNGFSWVKEILMVIGIALTAIGAVILGAPALVAGVIAGIVAFIATAVVLIKEHWGSIVGWFRSVWEGIKEIFSVVGEWFGGVFNSAKEGIISFFSPIVEFFGGVWQKIKELFSNVGNAIAEAITNVVSTAINFVLSKAIGIINGFISAINAAISVINAIPGVSITRLSKLQVPQLAKGGVIDKPTMSIIGEAGAEAVMPLENNTEWIGRLANMISSQMTGVDLKPTNSHINNTSTDNHATEYLTTTNNNNQTVQGDTDNSIVFSEGSIQVIVQNASEEEAIRFAKIILEYIKRQRELDKMLRYA